MDVLRAAACARVLAGAKENNKVRPFALGLILRRLISKTTTSIFRDRVAKALGMRQYGAGRPSGAEEMHKSIMTDLAARPSACLNSFDISNAHNAIERAAVIAAVRERVPELAPWVEPWLRVETTHVCTLAGAPPVQLHKDRGGDQGDPLINLLFPLAFHRVIEDMEVAATTVDKDARAYAYQDDVDLICLPAARSAARAAFYAGCGILGLDPNVSKETIYYGPTAARLPEPGCTLVDRPVVLRHGDQVMLPVVPSGDGASYANLASPEAAALATARHGFVQKLLRLRRGGLSAQLCLRLLRVRTATDFTFVARACGIPADVCTTLDDTLVDMVRQFAGADGWTDLTRRCCFLPFREGGLGLSSASMIAPLALAASWYALAEHVASRLGFPSVDIMRYQVPIVDLRLQDAQSLVKDVTADATLPSADARSGPSQRQLTRARVAEEADAVQAALSTDAVAASAFLSRGGPGAAAWLLCPTKPAHHFTDQQFSIALRARLGLLQPVGLGRCLHKKGDGSRCGSVLDRWGIHAMSCTCGGWSGRRHDSLRDSISAFAAAHGGSAVTECILPYASPSLPEARLDSVIRSAHSAGRKIIDVTVVTPLSQEMLRHGAAARAPGAAASAAARHKRAKYPLIHIIPFVVEHFGRWGEDALSLAKSLAPAPCSGRSEALAALYQDVACSIQKSNADAVLSAAGCPQG